MASERGATFLDSRIVAADFDWRAYDVEPERCKVRSASEFVDDVIAGFYAPDEAKGAYWPWDKANERGLRFRPGEVSCYAGINGHRKSLLTSQIALHLLRQDERCLMLSFEMPVVGTLQRMLRQSAGCEEPALGYIKAWHQWTAGRLWLNDFLGHCPPRQTLAVARYGIQELGVRHVFIDSLMRVVSAVDDYNSQKAFVDGLCRLTMELGAHVHLVAHARKGKNERDGIDKWDVKGTGEITDLVHNVLLVTKRADAADGEPDQWLESAKQRNGAFEGTLGLFFNPRSLGFGERPGGNWPIVKVGTEDGR